MKLQVKKRNGELVRFDESKIRNAMIKGFLEFGEMSEEKEQVIADTIEKVRTEAEKYADAIEVEEI